MRRPAAFTVEVRRTIRKPVKRPAMGAGRQQVAAPISLDDVDPPVDLSPDDLPVRDVNADLISPAAPSGSRFSAADRLFNLKPMGQDEGRPEIQARAPAGAPVTPPSKFETAEALFKKPEPPKADAPVADAPVTAASRRVLPSLLAPSYTGRDTVPGRMQQQADRLRAGYDRAAETRRGVPRTRQPSLFDHLESTTAPAPVRKPVRATVAPTEAQAEARLQAQRDRAQHARSVRAAAREREIAERAQKARDEKAAKRAEVEAAALAEAENKRAAEAARKAAQVEVEAARAVEEKLAPQKAPKAAKSPAATSWLDLINSSLPKAATQRQPTDARPSNTTKDDWSWADVMAEEDGNAEPVALTPAPHAASSRGSTAMLYNPQTYDYLKRYAAREHLPKQVAAKALKPGERWKRRIPVQSW